MNATLNATQSLTAVNGTVTGLATDALNAKAGAAPVGSAVSMLGRTDTLFSWGGYFQALAVLFLIVAALWAALWYVKRKGGFKILTMQGDLTLESRMALGPKKSLIVVRFLNKRVLLGVTDQQITMLTELPTDDEPSQHTAKAADFKAHLDGAVAETPDRTG